MTDLKQLQIPVTEIEIGTILALSEDETLTYQGKLVIRRMAFELDRLRVSAKTANDRASQLVKEFDRCCDVNLSQADWKWLLHNIAKYIRR